MSFSGIPAHCDKCGLDFRSNAINPGGAQLILQDVGINCPRCGAGASFYDGVYAPSSGGVYSLVRKVAETIGAPDVNRGNLEAFQILARAAQAGEISKETAIAQADQLSLAFGKLLKWANDNGLALSLLVGVITIVLTIYATIAADEASGQQHLDAQAQLQATLMLQQTQRKIYEQLQTLHSSDELPGLPPRPKQKTTDRPHTQTPRSGAFGTANRHERRKAARLAKRQL